MSTTIGTGVTQRGLNGTFNPTFEQTMTLWREICSLVGSDAAKEDYKWLGQVPMVREWRGDRQTQALRDFGQTILNKHWESTLAIDRDELADDQTGQLDMRVREMAQRFALHPDTILLSLINAGAATVCYDGQFFFDTDHAEGDSGSQSNAISADVATPSAPTEAEFEVALWAAVQQMAGFKDDHGEPWNYFQSFENWAGILVLVPVNMMRLASKVMGVNAASIISQTTNILAGKGKLMVSPRLTSTTKFYTMKVDDPMRPFIFQKRQELVQKFVDDPLKKDLMYTADSRYAVGYGLWQKAVQTTFV